MGAYIVPGWEPILETLNRWWDAVGQFLGTEGNPAEIEQWFREYSIWKKHDGTREGFGSAATKLCEWCAAHGVDSAALWRLNSLIHSHSPHQSPTPGGAANFAEIYRAQQEAMLAYLRLQAMAVTDKASNANANSAPAAPRVRVDVENCRVWIDNASFSVSPNAATILEALLAANGQWLSVSEIADVRTRDLNNLPVEVEAILERERGKGCRIKLDFLAK